MQKRESSRLVEMIFTLSRLMRENMSYSGKFTTLSLLQLQVLIFLKHHEKAHMREIAEHFTIELPSATSLLNKLHTMKLVKRQADRTDRRVVRIVLTAQGEDLLKEAMEERTKKINFMLSHLSEKDKEHLLRILQTICIKLGTASKTN